jgi:hypothetical protein
MITGGGGGTAKTGELLYQENHNLIQIQYEFGFN